MYITESEIMGFNRFEFDPTTGEFIDLKDNMVETYKMPKYPKKTYFDFSDPYDYSVQWEPSPPFEYTETFESSPKVSITFRIIVFTLFIILGFLLGLEIGNYINKFLNTPASSR